MTIHVYRFPDIVSLSDAAAACVIEHARRAIAGNGRLTMALSGGTTPRLLYERLARTDFEMDGLWQSTHVFWGDERCVGPEHKESNYGLARDALLSKVALPTANIHRIFGEAPNADREAARYETELRRFFYLHEPDTAGRFPIFDLVLLGIGADGHTASLFPGDSALQEHTRWAVAVRAPKGYAPGRRITLTLPVINNARTILFLVSGKGKTPVMQDILSDSETAREQYTAARVTARERVVWFVDTQTVGI